MKIVTAIIAAALVPGLIQAQETNSAASDLSVSTSIAYESTYVNMGSQYAEAIFVPTLDVGYKDFYAGLWMGVPVENTINYVTEADLSAGWNHALSETYSLDVGMTRYAYDAIVDDFMDKDNSLEFYVGLCTSLPLSPSLYIYRDIDCNQNTFELSGSHKFDLTEKAGINLTAAFGYISNDEIDYVYFGASADIEYTFATDTSAFAGVRAGGSDRDLVFGNIDDPDWRHNAVWMGFGVRTSF